MQKLDLSRWPPAFVRALGYQLASYVGPSVTSGDPMKLADRSEKFAEMAAAIARANCVNEEQMEAPPESEFITARGENGSRRIPGSTFVDFFGTPPRAVDQHGAALCSRRARFRLPCTRARTRRSTRRAYARAGTSWS